MQNAQEKNFILCNLLIEIRCQSDIMVSSNKGKALQSSEKVVTMEKYKRAIKRALHSFNDAKRNHNLNGAFSAIDYMYGIMMVALVDEQFSCKDYAKISHIHGAMLAKTWDM